MNSFSSKPRSTPVGLEGLGGVGDDSRGRDDGCHDHGFCRGAGDGRAGRVRARETLSPSRVY